MKRPTLGELMERERRLMILRLLRSEISYEMSDLLLLRAVAASGCPVNYERIRRDLEWLAKKELVQTEELPGQILSVTLTRAGDEVALGRKSVQGVDRPLPEG